MTLPTPAAVRLDVTPTFPDLETIRQALHRNQAGDAQLLAAMYAGRLCFSVDMGKWSAWDGQGWAIEDEGLLYGLIAEHVRAAYWAYAQSLHPLPVDAGWWEQEQRYKEYKRATGRMDKLGTLTHIEAVAKLARIYLRTKGGPR